MKKSFVKAEQRREDGHRYKHDLGQHFLYDTALLRSLVQRAGVTKADRVLEIGPGAGTLTVCLCEAAERVVAVEVDETVIPYLRVATEGFGNVEILQGDIRKMNLQAVTGPLGPDFCVVANIPYNITTPILDLFWGSGLPVRQMSVMVQKEVAQKLIANPGDSAYGLTSVRCHYYCEPQMVEEVPAKAFTPPPKVDSAFVNLSFRKESPAAVENEDLLWRLIRAGFLQRRKTLFNAIRGVAPCSGEPLREAIDQLGLPQTIRGEALDVPQWIALANALNRIPRADGPENPDAVAKERAAVADGDQA
ncbi:MAG TPA: 16S rRNA (adenine(1518)-N(6)/adenine(1519)-N(6))-dimethyltransferase RsmA [Candidatus Limiplasma sp.]|nr:16S rRNA (adenine(1518)-N(6)/adenine(1519)-N(6))-dimethyltransferase RsmA [Candidatus Limiplasma sp.]HPS80297.1 16S rRNA (adenine(1518)-N(6)/adenine(1519)-N(6))-dimethyltransferase RsmA [Candidatus Limiplasma sp.]